MLEAVGVGCVRGDRRLFSGVDLSLSPGRLLRVAGANGSGKTSLLRILCGLLTPAEGEVRWEAQPIARSREDYHRKLLYLGHANGVKDELTPAENLEIAAVLAGIPADRDARMAALDAFGLASRADLAVRHLSQGQRRRVALARLALSGTVPLWVLDEPFNALDAQAAARVQRLIAAHVAAGGMAVLTSHVDAPIDAVEVLVLDLDRPGNPA
jgi:heme exporter protein A